MVSVNISEVFNNCVLGIQVCPIKTTIVSNEGKFNSSFVSHTSAVKDCYF